MHSENFPCQVAFTSDEGLGQEAAAISTGATSSVTQPPLPTELKLYILSRVDNDTLVIMLRTSRSEFQALVRPELQRRKAIIDLRTAVLPNDTVVSPQSRHELYGRLTALSILYGRNGPAENTATTVATISVPNVLNMLYTHLNPTKSYLPVFPSSHLSTNSITARAIVTDRFISSYTSPEVSEHTKHFIQIAGPDDVASAGRYIHVLAVPTVPVDAELSFIFPSVSMLAHFKEAIEKLLTTKRVKNCLTIVVLDDEKCNIERPLRSGAEDLQQTPETFWQSIKSSYQVEQECRHWDLPLKDVLKSFRVVEVKRGDGSIFAAALDLHVETERYRARD